MMKMVIIKVSGGIGNKKNQELLDILSSENTITFRNNLILKINSLCKKCVCSLNLSPILKLW